MANVIQTPSFWDYLGQGYTQGHEYALQAQARNDQLRREEEARKRQDLQFAMTNGTIDDARRIAQAIPGMEGIMLEESIPQLQRRFLATPNLDVPDVDRAQVRDPNAGLTRAMSIPQAGKPAALARQGATSSQAIRQGPGTHIAAEDRFSDVQRSMIGAPTRLDRRRERSDAAQLDLTDRQTASDMANFPMVEQLKMFQALGPAMTLYANNFVSAEVLQNGGKIKESDLPVLSDIAFQRFIREQQSKGFGNLTPQAADMAKQFFYGATMDAWRDQQDREIRRLNALPSSAFGRGSDNTAALSGALSRMADSVGNTQELQRELNTILGGPMGAAAQMFMNNPAQPAPPFMQGPIARIQELQTTMANRARMREELQSVNAMFMSGHLTPEEAQAKLTEASRVLGGSVRPAAPIAGAQPADGSRVPQPTMDPEERLAREAMAQPGADIAGIKAEYKRRTGKDLR